MCVVIGSVNDMVILENIWDVFKFKYEIVVWFVKFILGDLF